MAQPSSGAGSIPLTEYRRDVPPGWPGIADYPLRSYFEKLRLWYRVFEGADEVVGPLVAGRLVGRAQKLAVSLRLPRPNGGADVGDEALVRLSVDEVRDPMNPEIIIQHHIPSGVQALCNALRDAFGQSDQDMVSRSLEAFFEFKRGKLSLQEYSVEWDLRYDEAETRSNLHLNDVAKFYLFFKQSGLPTKFIEDIKLQLHGDLARFAEARTLALRLSQRGQDDHDHVFYEEGQAADEPWADEWNSDWTWSCYEDEVEPTWHDHAASDAWWYEDDGYWDNGYYDYDAESWPQGDVPHDANAETNESTTDGATEDFYNGNQKGKNAMGVGCAICGSKWHSSTSCPVNLPDKGKGQPFGKGKNYGKFRSPSKGYCKKGKGYGFRQPYSWRSGKFKGYGGGKGYGKRYGKKGKGKSFADYDHSAYHVRPPLDTNYVRQDFPSS